MAIWDFLLSRFTQDHYFEVVYFLCKRRFVPSFSVFFRDFRCQESMDTND